MCICYFLFWVPDEHYTSDQQIADAIVLLAPCAGRGLLTGRIDELPQHHGSSLRTMNKQTAAKAVGNCSFLFTEWKWMCLFCFFNILTAGRGDPMLAFKMGDLGGLVIKGELLSRKKKKNILMMLM